MPFTLKECMLCAFKRRELATINKVIKSLIVLSFII